MMPFDGITSLPEEEPCWFEVTLSRRSLDNATVAKAYLGSSISPVNHVDQRRSVVDATM